MAYKQVEHVGTNWYVLRTNMILELIKKCKQSNMQLHLRESLVGRKKHRQGKAYTSRAYTI